MMADTLQDWFHSADYWLHTGIWQTDFADRIFPANWSASDRYGVTVFVTVAIAIWLALFLTFWRRVRKGFRGFDVTAIATVNWMFSIGLYFVLAGIRIYQLIDVTVRQPTPWWLEWTRDYVWLSTIVFIVMIVLDKRVLVPVDVETTDKNGKIVWGRRASDWERESNA